MGDKKLEMGSIGWLMGLYFDNLLVSLMKWEISSYKFSEIGD